MSEPGDPNAPPDPDPIDPNDPNAPDPTFPAEPEAPPPPTAPPTDDDLREAVGVARREKPEKARAARPIEDDRDARDTRDERDDDLADEPPLTAEQQARRRRLWLTLAFSTVIGLVIVAFVFIGRSNASRYYFQCGAAEITAEHGRGFPPWGTRELDGPEWAPIAIPPQAECQTRETEEPSELAGWFLDALIDQARAKLTAREVTAVDDAEKQLRQAYLLARDPKRVDQRNEIDRLLGDVQYWRGIAKVKSANDALADAAKLFDEAAARKPVKVTTSAAWADYARKLVDDLKLGPDALRPDVPLGAGPAPLHEQAPPGVALPVEPPIDANMGAPITPPDAGVPSGGVLL